MVVCVGWQIDIQLTFTRVIFDPIATDSSQQMSTAVLSVGLKISICSLLERATILKIWYEKGLKTSHTASHNWRNR